MSRLKEPHFFGPKPGFVRSVSDAHAYLRLFDASRPGQLRGEASTTYLSSAQAAHAIARVRPDARILVALREPVASAYSSYWHKVRYGRESRTFLEATRANVADPARATRPNYAAEGLYAESLARYFRLFEGRVWVTFLEELTADPRAELRRIFRFLGVDEDHADPVDFTARNATGLPRNALVRRAYVSTRLRSIAERVLPNALAPRLERVFLRRAAVPPIPAEARRLLEELYASEPAALERLLGRPVPWAAASPS